MITAQDIHEKRFEKSRIGGYEMSDVDDFLEEIADEITAAQKENAAAQKENAVLKSKMKVLVDKIEEYRANEEALHMAVLSAQKLAVQIENDARARAAAMIEDAERQVKARTGGIEEEVARQEKRLAEARAASEKFFSSMRAICTAQMKNLDTIATKVFDVETPAMQTEPSDDDVRVREMKGQNPAPQTPVMPEYPAASEAPAKPRRKLDGTQTFSL